jgi:hypothetical protein
MNAKAFLIKAAVSFYKFSVGELKKWMLAMIDDPGVAIIAPTGRLIRTPRSA